MQDPDSPPRARLVVRLALAALLLAWLTDAVDVEPPPPAGESGGSPGAVDG